eukprot:2175962-Prymnesium_polylepis.1
MKPKVPQVVIIGSSSSGPGSLRAKPKSQSLTAGRGFSGSGGSAKRTFSGLISRCTMFNEWRCSSAEHSPRPTRAQSPSVIRFRSVAERGGGAG